MKGNFLKNYNYLLTSGNLLQFESKMTFHFFVRFAKRLCLDYCFTDWLVTTLRLGRNLIDNNYLKSDYLSTLNNKTFIDDKDFIMFLLLLEFAAHSDFYVDFLSYPQVTFTLQDFLKHLNPDCGSTNSYQTKKILNFLNSFKSNFFVTYFTHK
jgi:hypothetical protein